MPLVLEYRNTKDDLLAQFELYLKDNYLSTRSKYNQRVAVGTGLLVLAGYFAYQAGHIGFLVMFVVVAGTYLFESLPYSRIYWTSVEQSLLNRKETLIKMEVREDGLFETEEGIQSFVPWSSIISYTEFKNTLFIRLTAGLCAIVPLSSVTPSPSLVNELIRVLQDKGISESTS